MTVSTMTIALLVAAMPQAGKKPAAKPAAKAAPLPAGVVARYNGVDITLDDIKKQLNTTRARRVVPEIIQRIVIEREAKKAGVSVTDAEIAEKVKEEEAKVVSQMAGSGKMMTFKDITREYGLTEAEVTQTVRLNLLARKACEKALLKETTGLDGQLRLAHILLATVPLSASPGTPQLTPELQKKKDDEQKARIEQILADVRGGKLKFDDAAKQFSDDKGSGSQGGELPWAGKKAYVQEFENAAFALAKVGEISAPVKSQFGWHIIKLLEKGSEASPDAKEKFRKSQVDQKLNQPGAIQNWLATQASSAKIEFNTSTKLFK